MRVRFAVLGPLAVEVGGKPLAVGGPKQRVVLALLLAEQGHIISVDRLTEALWGETPPDDPRGVIQAHVSNLRRALQPAAQALRVEQIIVTRAPGYAAAVPEDALDIRVFERLTSAARGSVATGDLVRAKAQLGEALSLWQGGPLADLADEESLRGTIARLERARLTVSTDRIELEMALGNHREILEDLHNLVSANPLDERLRGLLMLAMYRSGRQSEALAVYQEGRRLLVEELGVDPGIDLRELEEKILRQASDLALPARGNHRRDLSTTIGSSVLTSRAAIVVDGRRFPLSARVTTIGRASGQSIVLDDGKASRRHAEVRASSSGLVLVDVGSRNGTRLNGAPIVAATAITSGDVIAIGSTTLHIEQD